MRARAMCVRALGGWVGKAVGVQRRVEFLLSQHVLARHLCGGHNEGAVPAANLGTGLCGRFQVRRCSASAEGGRPKRVVARRAGVDEEMGKEEEERKEGKDRVG